MRKRPDVDKKIASAVTAFASVQENRLLGAWEATLASSSHSRIASRHKATLRQALIHGAAADGKADPLSLAAKAGTCLEQFAKANPRHKPDTTARALCEFLRALEQLADERFVVLFDGSQYAGLAMLASHDATDDATDDAPAPTPIGNAAQFKQAIRQLVEQAAQSAGQKFDTANGGAASPGNLAKEEIRFIASSLSAYIGKPGDNDFLRNLVAQFTPAPANASADAPMQPDVLWKISVGGHGEELAASYFGKNVGISSSANGYVPDPDRPRDATHILEFLFDNLRSVRSSTMPRMLAIAHRDVLSLTPGSLDDDRTPFQTAREWIERRLKAPAENHAHIVRTEPPLGELLADAVDLIRHRYGEDEFTMDVEQLIRQVGGVDGAAYTLQAVHDALIEAPTHSCVTASGIDRNEFLDTVATVLLQIVPTPAVEIADTYRASPTRPGTTERLGVLYNPFRDTVNLHVMDETHDGHAPARQDWIRGPWCVIAIPSRPQ
jgi:hypothetical protein